MHFAFDEEAALIYGSVMGNARLNGRQMSVPDGMVAAITLRHKAKLATRNVKDFVTTGVEIVNPWEWRGAL